MRPRNHVTAFDETMTTALNSSISCVPHCVSRNGAAAGKRTTKSTNWVSARHTPQSTSRSQTPT